MRPLLLLAMIAGCGFQVSGQGSDAGDGSLDGPGGDDDALARDADLDVMPGDAPRATVSYTQGTSSVGGGVTMVTLLLTQAIAAGDLCIVGVGSQGGNVASVSDSGNNTYVNVIDADEIRVFVAANMGARADNTVTITFNGPSGYAAAVAVYRGLATVDPVDSKNSAMSTATALDSGEVQTTHAHELLVGFAASDGTLTAGSMMTARTIGSYLLLEDREVDVTGTYRATATASGNATSSIGVVALKAAD